MVEGRGLEVVEGCGLEKLRLRVVEEYDQARNERNDFELRADVFY